MGNDENKVKVDVPEPPALLPTALQEKWKKDYTTAHLEAQENDPNDSIAQRQSAHREANRVLRTPKLNSADDAKKLATWQVLTRKVVDGVLKVVTIDGKKYSFAVGKEKPDEEDKVGTGSENGAGGEKKSA